MALLATVTVPAMFPVADGVKVTCRVAVCPGASICPVGRPLAEYPAPEMLTLEIAMLVGAAFVIVTPKALLPPTLTFPKLRLDALAASDLVPVPEPVCPAQPERNSAATKVKKMGSNRSGVRSFIIPLLRA